MINIILIYLIIGNIIGRSCSKLASKKKQNRILWFFLGFFFGFLALFAIYQLSPSTGNENTYNRYKYEDYD